MASIQPLYDRPGDDYEPHKGDIWTYEMSTFFPRRCVRIGDINEVAVSYGGNDGWNIETIVTLVKDSDDKYQLLTGDFSVNRWIDGDGAVQHRRFMLTFI